MRREGCKDGCFWTTVSSGTCAKAVCSHLSQCQLRVGCQGKPCGCDWPSQLRKTLFSNFLSYSQIFKLLKSLKISRMFIYSAIKHYKELWKVDDRAQSGRLKSVGAEATIKTVWERIAKIHSANRRSYPESWTYHPKSSCASSGTIYIWERTSAQRDTSWRLLWRRSDG